MDTRNPSYVKNRNPVSSQQQEMEAVSMTNAQTQRVDELVSITCFYIIIAKKKKRRGGKSLSLEAVTQKVSMIESRMSVLEASFDILLQKTAELWEDLRLARERLEMKDDHMHRALLVLEETERVKMEMENFNHHYPGER